MKRREFLGCGFHDYHKVLVGPLKLEGLVDYENAKVYNLANSSQVDFVWVSQGMVLPGLDVFWKDDITLIVLIHNKAALALCELRT